MINVATRGTLNSKTLEVIEELIKEMVMNNYQWYTSRVKPSKLTSVYDVDAITALVVQVEALSKMINGLSAIQ